MEIQEKDNLGSGNRQCKTHWGWGVQGTKRSFCSRNKQAKGRLESYYKIPGKRCWWPGPESNSGNTMKVEPALANGPVIGCKGLCEQQEVWSPIRFFFSFSLPGPLNFCHLCHSLPPSGRHLEGTGIQKNRFKAACGFAYPKSVCATQFYNLVILK